MSNLTNELNLFKYNTSTDGKQVFSIDTAMNDNWDKIDAFATAIKSLSNLNELGEKRFNDINTQLGKKLEADVLLEENGYIKFNNLVVIQWGKVLKGTKSKAINVTFPIAYMIKCQIYVQKTNSNNYAKEHVTCIWTQNIDSFSFVVRGYDSSGGEDLNNFTYLAIGF